MRQGKDAAAVKVKASFFVQRGMMSLDAWWFFTYRQQRFCCGKNNLKLSFITAGKEAFYFPVSGISQIIIWIDNGVRRQIEITNDFLKYFVTGVIPGAFKIFQIRQRDVQSFR